MITSQVAYAQIIPTGSTAPAAQHLLPPPAAYNSTAKINYVRTWEPWKPITDASLVPAQPVADVKQTTAYIDGLGRPIQTVTRQISPVRTNRYKGQVLLHFFSICIKGFTRYHIPHQW